MNDKLKQQIHDQLVAIIPETINDSFNRALKVLIDNHRLFGTSDVIMIDLSKKPSSIGRTVRNYRIWMDALITVIEIGHRLNFIHWNVDRSGRMMYLSLEMEHTKRVAKSKRANTIIPPKNWEEAYSEKRHEYEPHPTFSPLCKYCGKPFEHEIHT